MWKVKVLIQFALSKIPMGEKINYLLQKAKGSHNVAIYKKRVLLLSKNLRQIDQQQSLNKKIVVDIGTGWEAINPLLFYLFGVRTCYSYDHLPHVRFDLVQLLLTVIDSQLTQIAQITHIPIVTLQERLEKLKNHSDVESLFTAANIVYIAPGDATKTGLNNASVDLVYSHSVLAHVSEELIHSFTEEAKRILKSKGMMYHCIWLQDNYTSIDKKLSKVNFLKYPEKLWAFFIYNDISYHNRLREKQYLDIFKSHQGEIAWIEHLVDQKDVKLLKTMKIDEKFLDMTAEELAVYNSKILIYFPKNTLTT